MSTMSIQAFNDNYVAVPPCWLEYRCHGDMAGTNLMFRMRWCGWNDWAQQGYVNQGVYSSWKSRKSPEI